MYGTTDFNVPTTAQDGDEKGEIKKKVRWGGGGMEGDKIYQTAVSDTLIGSVFVSREHWMTEI